MASKNRKNKAKFKLRKELVFLVLGLVAMLVATILLSLPSSTEKFVEKVNTYITNVNANANSSSQITTLPVTPENIKISELESFEDLLEAKNKGVGKTGLDEYVIVFYGSSSSSEFLGQLASYNGLALENERNNCYIYFSTEVDEAEDKNDVDFIKDMDEKESKLNELEDQSSVEMIDLVENLPALWVFKSGKLVYNSQVAKDSSEYNWNVHLTKAFGLGAIA